MVSTRYTRPAPAWTSRRPLVLVCRTRSRSTSLSSPRSEARRSAARTWRRRTVRKLIASARDSGRTRIEIASTPDRASTGAVSRFDLGRPAPTKRYERQSVRTFDDVGADVVLGAFPREHRCRWPSSSWRLGAVGSRALRPYGARSSATLATVVSLTPESTIKHRRGGRASLAARSAIQTSVCRQELTRRAWDWREPVEVFGRTPLDGHDRIWNGRGSRRTARVSPRSPRPARPTSGGRG